MSNEYKIVILYKEHDDGNAMNMKVEVNGKIAPIPLGLKKWISRIVIDEAFNQLEEKS